MKGYTNAQMFNPKHATYWRAEITCQRCVGMRRSVRLSQWAVEETCAYCRGRGRAALPLTELFNGARG